MKYPNLTAMAGLNGDWNYTAGIIFTDGKPTNNDYTYLSSNWATPMLALSYNGLEEEIECWSKEEETRFNSDSKWDENSLKVLGIDLLKEEEEEE